MQKAGDSIDAQIILSTEVGMSVEVTRDEGTLVIEKLEAKTEGAIIGSSRKFWLLFFSIA